MAPQQTSQDGGMTLRPNKFQKGADGKVIHIEKKSNSAKKNQPQKIINHADDGSFNFID